MTDSSRPDEEIFDEYLDQIRAACYEKLLNSEYAPRSDKAHPIAVDILRHCFKISKQTEKN